MRSVAPCTAVPAPFAVARVLCKGRRVAPPWYAACATVAQLPMFRIAGLVDPTIAVKPEPRVKMEVINADKATSHGMVVTASKANSSWMPMMTANPAFGGSAVWFLGEPTSADMHASTISFTASAHGSY